MQRAKVPANELGCADENQSGYRDDDDNDDDDDNKCLVDVA